MMTFIFSPIEAGDDYLEIIASKICYATVGQVSATIFLDDGTDHIVPVVEWQRAATRMIRVTVR
jgi:hypothetical protein